MLNADPRHWKPESRPSGTRILFSWPQITVGAFDCWPDDASWRCENVIVTGHLIAFPGTAVEIIQHGYHPTVVDPNQVVLYNRDQVYRRRLVDSSGDHCTYLIVSPALLAELADSGAAPIRDPDRHPFTHPVLPISRSDHLEQQSILHVLRAGHATDPLELQERLAQLVGRALGQAGAGRRVRPRRRATEREHRRIVDDTRAVLAVDLGRPMSLDDVARAVGTSVFHVSRLFRGRVGMSMHAYRDELRLRTALPEVLEGSRPLTEVALDHGYATPSHFAERFRARYGIAPSRLRARMTRPANVRAKP